MSHFNFSLQCSPQCSIELAELRTCEIETMRSLLTLTFDVKDIKPGIFAMDAYPFILYKRIDN